MFQLGGLAPGLLLFFSARGKFQNVGDAGEAQSTCDRPLISGQPTSLSFWFSCLCIGSGLIFLWVPLVRWIYGERRSWWAVQLGVISSMGSLFSGGLWKKVMLVREMMYMILSNNHLLPFPKIFPKCTSQKPIVSAFPSHWNMKPVTIDSKMNMVTEQGLV